MKQIFAMLPDSSATPAPIIEDGGINVVDSLNYAWSMQKEMFPKESLLQEYFPGSFIFHQPKDIVSGDFYWFAKLEEGFLIAVADCTGHGVPGAMMSMVGYSLINEAVLVAGISKPSGILNYLDAGFKRLLRQSSGDRLINDGMDIVLCLVNKEREKLEFSGANRPLFLFKKGSIDVICGEKYSIGNERKPENFQFVEHSMGLEDIEMVILSTDGIIDQFGGSSKKKFMKKRFVGLLEAECGNSDVGAGKVIADAFHNWKGEQEQTDDVLVAGIKL